MPTRVHAPARCGGAAAPQGRELRIHHSLRGEARVGSRRPGARLVLGVFHQLAGDRHEHPPPDLPQVQQHLCLQELQNMTCACIHT